MLIDWENVKTMCSEDIENLRCEQLKDVETMNDGMSIVQDEYDALSKKIILLEIEKRDIAVAIRKQKDNIRKKKVDIEILKSKFWERKN